MFQVVGVPEIHLEKFWPSLRLPTGRAEGGCAQKGREWERHSAQVPHPPRSPRCPLPGRVQEPASSCPTSPSHCWGHDRVRFPGEQVPGPWHESTSGWAPWHPSLMILYVFKPLLPKCQLDYFCGYFSASTIHPRAVLALRNGLIKAFISRNKQTQKLGPGAPGFLESSAP